MGFQCKFVLPELPRRFIWCGQGQKHDKQNAPLKHSLLKTNPAKSHTKSPAERPGRAHLPRVTHRHKRCRDQGLEPYQNLQGCFCTDPSQTPLKISGVTLVTSKEAARNPQPVSPPLPTLVPLILCLSPVMGETRGWGEGGGAAKETPGRDSCLFLHWSPASRLRFSLYVK